jgi:hypothetical protein
VDMKNHLQSYLLALLLLALTPPPKCPGGLAQHVSSLDKCPPLALNPACPCYNFEDGIFLECPAISFGTLRGVLEQVRAPIKSLSLYDLEKNVTVLPDNLFPNHTAVTHLQITQSSIKTLRDNSLQTLRVSLESLGILHAQLQSVPQRALSGLALRGLNLEGNSITELPSYSFYGLHLMKVSHISPVYNI